MKPDTPKITMLILTYNRADLVERTIQSVLAQSYKDYELVLVDNGSVDATPEVFEKYRKEENVRIFRIEENIGFARGFNYCLDQIRGEWFATVGDDDTIREDALELLFDVLDKVDSDLTAVSSNGWDTSTNDYSGIGLSADQYLPIETIVQKCDGDFWGMTKTSLIRDIRLNPNIPGLEDTFWYKVDAAAKRYYIHQPLITYYTNHGGNETQKQSADIGVKSKLYKELLSEPFFWEVLQKYNKKQFRDRCIKAMHFLKAAGEETLYRTYRQMLLDDRPGLKYRMHSQLIGLLSPSMLTQLYQMKRKAS
ncbi:MAG: glycosyltransferase family A protein [Bacteroidota bacterium]